MGSSRPPAAPASHDSAVSSQPSSSGSGSGYGWLWLVIALQIAVPASYYFKADRDDERFAWRMFSAVRVKRCEVRLRELKGGQLQEAKLEYLLHASWRQALARGRRRVMEKLLSERCRTPGLQRVELVRSCKDAKGAALPTEVMRLTCASSSWSFTQGEP